MSTDITSIAGYNQQSYEDLAAQYTERTGKTQTDLTSKILEYAKEGKSFDEAVKLISDELPTLKTPVYEQGFCLYTGSAPASFGSTYLALIQELAADQRKQAADAKALQTEAMVSNIEQQAKNIRTKAGVEFAASIVSGAAQITAGAVSIGMTASALNAKLDAATLNTRGTQIQGISSTIQGAGTVLSSPFQLGASMVEAKNKELEADAERLRATKEQLDRVDDAMRELLQKARSTQETIQQNMNQTRSKILG